MARFTEKLQDALRYAIYVCWLHGQSSASIARATKVLSDRQVKHVIADSPYRGKKSMAFKQRQQFLADLLPLRVDLCPTISLRLFAVSKELPTSDERIIIPSPLVERPQSLHEVLANHFEAIGDEDAAQAARARANVPGRDGRPRILERYNEAGAVVDIGSSTHAYFYTRNLYTEPESCHNPIRGAGIMRQTMVERFVKAHETAAMSPVGTPDLGVFVDGGGGKEALSIQKYEAMKRIGLWKRAGESYRRMCQWFIEDSVKPSTIKPESVRYAIDRVLIADGAPIAGDVQRRWQGRAA